MRHVTRAFQNAEILVAIPQLGWPASLDGSGRMIAVVFVDVHHVGQAQLAQIIHASNATTGLLRPGQCR